MDKEMKKLLLVAVSVGVFLLITITVAILILNPKAAVEGTSFSSSVTYPTGTIPPVPETIIDTQPQPVITREVAETNREDSNVAVISDRNDGDRLTINIPKPTAVAVPETQATPPTPPAAPTPTATVTPAVTAPRPAATATATPVVAPVPAAAPKPAAAKTINDFWVQTGAFTAQIRAEDAKETLASKGITSIIENRLIDGKIWYRVRLGPYTSEREANYWLALVKTIDGFGESQVRQTVRQQ